MRLNVNLVVTCSSACLRKRRNIRARVEHNSHHRSVTLLKKCKHRRLLVVLLFSCVLLTTYVLADNRTVGVKQGDWIEYAVTFTGGPPVITWVREDILNVTETSVAVKTTTRWYNGSETVETLNLNLTTPAGTSMNWVGRLSIPPDSRMGDSVNVQGYPLTIGGENNRTYVGTKRTVVSAGGSMGSYMVVFYWDKQTGVMLQAIFISEGHVTDVLATATSLWGGGLLGLDWWLWMIMLVSIFVILGTAGILWTRRRRVTGNSDSSSSTRS